MKAEQKIENTIIKAHLSSLKKNAHIMNLFRKNLKGRANKVKNLSFEQGYYTQQFRI